MADLNQGILISWPLFKVKLEPSSAAVVGAVIFILSF